MAVTAEERFWPKVDKNGPVPNHRPELGNCWLWTAASMKFGHGVIRVNGKNFPAHRFSYNLHVGPIPDGLIIRHKCDTPACVNPSHLETGTHKDNVHDCMARGRMKARGKLNGQAKLSELSVDALRILYNTGKFTMRELGLMFHVTTQTVHRAVRGIDWQHVPLPSDQFIRFPTRPPRSAVA